MSEAGILVPHRLNSNADTAPRILIIDDEAAIRESLETLLLLEGYAVDLAPEGQAGLRCIDTRTYDLVLLDLALPGQNGIEILARIRERQPNLPVIMITAYGTVGNVWPISVRRRHGSGRKKRMSSSSGRSNSDITLKTSLARASRCCASSTWWRRWLLPARPS
jgi:CheY-like chemotaxis protein